MSATIPLLIFPVAKTAVQELSNILESLASQRASSGAANADDGMEADMDNDAAPDDAGDDDADPDDQADDVSTGKATAGLLQTFVFSATLTLPEKLRKRLRRGVNFVCQQSEARAGILKILNAVMLDQRLGTHQREVELWAQSKPVL